MRIPVVGLVGGALLGLTASCAVPPPDSAAPPPAPAVAASEPAPLVAPLPPPPAVAAAPPPVSAEVAAAPPPTREVEYVPVPLVWQQMMTKPLPSGRLMLNNFSFEPTRIQAALVSGPVCAVGDPSTVTEFVLPSNGTRVIPTPPGVDICWRRERVAGETAEPRPAGPWTAWSRAYTGPGRFLDTAVVMPGAPESIAAPTGPAPALPATLAPTFPMPALPPVQR